MLSVVKENSGKLVLPYFPNFSFFLGTMFPNVFRFLILGFADLSTICEFNQSSHIGEN